MPISVEMMRSATRAGMSVVCASCERYWEARNQGIPGDSCTANEPCGGPLQRRTFPLYRGIMGPEEFRRFCFVCGAAACFEVTGGPRLVGVCAEHMKWLAEEPDARLVRAGDALPANWLGVPPEKLRGRALPPASSLGGKILAQEKAWAEQDGRDFDLEELAGRPRVDGGDQA